MRKHAYAPGSDVPLVRLRLMFIGIIALMVVIALPLVIVWKQAYIASTSVRIEALTDTISAMNRRIAGLEIVCGAHVRQRTDRSLCTFGAETRIPCLGPDNRYLPR